MGSRFLLSLVLIERSLFVGQDGLLRHPPQVVGLFLAGTSRPWWFRVTANVKMTPPSAEGNLTPLGDDSGFLSRAHVDPEAVSKDASIGPSGQRHQGDRAGVGVSRNTIRKSLRGEAVSPKYRPRAPRPCKLDPFKAYLLERVVGVAAGMTWARKAGS